MAASTVCPQCGTSVNPNTRFCPECGYPIQAEFYQSQPNRPAPVQPTQKMDEAPDFSAYPAAEPDYYTEPEKPRSRRMWYLLGGGAVLLACCALAGILLIVSALSGDGFSISLFGTDTPTPTATATYTPTPTVTPTPPPTNTPAPLPPTLPPQEPTAESNDLGLTGNQSLSDTEFFEDFSSTAMNWAVETTENTTVGYEGEAYFVQITTPGYIQVVQPPIETLNHLEYNAEVVNGGNNGTFGIACYFVDIDNFTYMVFDNDQSVRFAQYVNGELTQLSDWITHSQPMSGARVGGDCTGGGMVAYVNNTQVAQISVNKPDGPFEMWLYALTWSDRDGQLKVLFDNVSGYLSQ